MTAVKPMQIKWRAREIPLPPVAAAATGGAARLLGLRLLEWSDAQLGALRGAAGPGLLVVLGEAETLPWVDGIVYLGRDPAAPALLIPTTLEPDVPIALVERAITAGMKNASLVAVLATASLLVPASSASSIARDTLRGWVEAFG